MSLSLGAAVLIAASVAMILAPRLTAEQPGLPPALGALRLARTFTGSEASTIVNRMHGKAVTPRSSAIGMYAGASGKATLYLSTYAEPRDAEQARKDMIRGIETGHTPFTGLGGRTIEGRELSSCVGQGQAHYFFAAGPSLYWLAVDFAVAAPTLEALLASRKPAPGRGG